MTQTAFIPQQNGFAFVNYFQIQLPGSVTLPLIGTIQLNNVVFGLCGGMSYAALDYFYAKAPPPHYNTPQEIAPALYNYLVSRVNKIVLDMERAATEIVNIVIETGNHQAA